MWTVIGGGLLALVGLAIFVGHALDRQSRDAAWRRIASSRRTNAEDRRDLEELAVALDAREIELDRRERRADLREDMTFRREAALEELERSCRERSEPPRLSA